MGEFAHNRIDTHIIDLPTRRLIGDIRRLDFCVVGFIGVYSISNNLDDVLSNICEITIDAKDEN